MRIMLGKLIPSSLFSSAGAWDLVTTLTATIACGAVFLPAILHQRARAWQAPTLRRLGLSMCVDAFTVVSFSVQLEEGESGCACHLDISIVAGQEVQLPKVANEDRETFLFQETILTD
jgi:hypothetical protein